MFLKDSPWLPPPANLTLAGNEVHVWRAALNQPASVMQNLAQILSNDEQERAGRFHFERDRRRFIAGRGILRTILGQYLNIEPGRLQFCYGPQGKPNLAEQLGGDVLRFNLAHSHELALYAFTYEREIGIDLEYLHRPLPDMERIAARFFSMEENAALRKLPAGQRQRAFFNCWTRKEAYIKAIGEGLALPLDEFDVSLTPGEPAVLKNVRKDPQKLLRCSLQELSPGQSYVAALAVEKHDWRLSCWQWSK